MKFQKGKSGNPKGSVRRINAATIECRKLLKEAMDVLIGNLASEDEDTRHRAAVELLNRGFGKPTEYIELDADIDSTVEHKGEALKKFTAEELKRLVGLV